jgi:hypothetical protein
MICPPTGAILLPSKNAKCFLNSDLMASPVWSINKNDAQILETSGFDLNKLTPFKSILHPAYRLISISSA